MRHGPELTPVTGDAVLAPPPERLKKLWRKPAVGGLGKKEGRELQSIQYLRGIAAFMVVLYHASHYLDVIRGDTSFRGLSALGLFGVAIFFAISGYLMATLVWRTDPWQFMAHRVVRIYPTLLIVVALFATVSVLRGAKIAIDPIALTLVPSGLRPYPLGVEWTLVFEVTFYFALFLVVIGGWTKRLDALAIVWLGLLALTLVWRPEQQVLPPLYRLPVIDACAGFAAGLLIPTALRSGLVPRWSLPVGAALTVTSALLDSGRFAASLIAALIVAGAVRVDPGSGTPLFAPLKKLGDWSYALYLCHVPVILLVYQLMPPAVNTKALWALSIAVAVAVGAALGSLDVRLYRWAKAMVDRSRATPLRLAVGAYLIMFTTVAAFSSIHVLTIERREAQERAFLARLGPNSLRDSNAASAAIIVAGISARASIRGHVGAVEIVKGGLAVRGWLVDLDDPGRSLSVAVFHNGAQIAVARPWRRRPEVARALGRPELASAKIGFGFGAPSIQCAAGDTVVVLGLDLTGGGALVLPGNVTIAGCSGA